MRENTYITLSTITALISFYTKYSLSSIKHAYTVRFDFKANMFENFESLNTDFYSPAAPFGAEI